MCRVAAKARALRDRRVEVGQPRPPALRRVLGQLVKEPVQRGRAPLGEGLLEVRQGLAVLPERCARLGAERSQAPVEGPAPGAGEHRRGVLQRWDVPRGQRPVDLAVRGGARVPRNGGQS